METILSWFRWTFRTLLVRVIFSRCNMCHTCLSYIVGTSNWIVLPVNRSKCHNSFSLITYDILYISAMLRFLGRYPVFASFRGCCDSIALSFGICFISHLFHPSFIYFMFPCLSYQSNHDLKELLMFSSLELYSHIKTFQNTRLSVRCH